MRRRVVRFPDGSGTDVAGDQRRLACLLPAWDCGGPHKGDMDVTIRRLRRYRVYLVMLVPALAYYALFHYVPMYGAPDRAPPTTSPAAMAGKYSIIRSISSCRPVSRCRATRVSSMIASTEAPQGTPLQSVRLPSGLRIGSATP
jgi:hypothetical protein